MFHYRLSISCVHLLGFPVHSLCLFSSALLSCASPSLSPPASPSLSSCLTLLRSRVSRNREEGKIRTDSFGTQEQFSTWTLPKLVHRLATMLQSMLTSALHQALLKLKAERLIDGLEAWNENKIKSIEIYAIKDVKRGL